MQEGVHATQERERAAGAAEREAAARGADVALAEAQRAAELAAEAAADARADAARAREQAQLDARAAEVGSSLLLPSMQKVTRLL
jgi:hypothetical protein